MTSLLNLYLVFKNIFKEDDFKAITNTQWHVHLEKRLSKQYLVPFLHIMMKLYKIYAICLTNRPQ